MAAAEMFVTAGATATISLAGDTSEGCKMLQELPSSRVISCCFSTASREDRLCDCRGRGGQGGFILEEREGHCVLTLNNFTRNDQGTYKAMFNANLEDNKELKVMLDEEGDSLVWIITVGLVLVILGLVGIIVLVFQNQKCWKKEEQEGEPEEEQEEMEEMVYKCDRTWCKKEFKGIGFLKTHKVNHEWRPGDPED